MARNGIPVTYFTGRKGKLPKKILSNIRLIFADIVLETAGQSSRTKIAKVINVLTKILGVNPLGPYLIIAWTKHPEEVTELNNKINEVFSNNLPIAPVVAIEKSACQNDDDSYSIRKIEMQLKRVLSSFNAFHLFVIWESLVSKSSAEIVNDFASFYNRDANWNQNICNLFYSLAKANAGNQLNETNINEISRNALLTFNGAFKDVLENKIKEFKYNKEVGPFDNTPNSNAAINSKINSKLLLTDFYGNCLPQPGNVYDATSEHKLEIIDCYAGDLSKSPKKDELLGQVKYIILEISPPCDYAQNKWAAHRILCGLLWPEAYKNKIENAPYIYKSDPSFKIGDNIYKMVFNLRSLKSLPLGKLKNRKLIFRMRNELLAEIQSHIAKHINRPGIISIR